MPNISREKGEPEKMRKEKRKEKGVIFFGLKTLPPPPIM